MVGVATIYLYRTAVLDTSISVQSIPSTHQLA